jgi:hypothetical protein
MTITRQIHSCQRFANRYAIEFYKGWLAGVAIIAGGKVWTHLFCQTKTVPALLGHIGTPIFRQQLAVFILVSSIFWYISDKFIDRLNPNLETPIRVFRHMTSTAIGSLAAATTSTSTYLKLHKLAFGVLIFSYVWKRSYNYNKDIFKNPLL